MNTYTKKGVKLHEYNMHSYVYNLGIVNCPKIISYDKKNEIMVMEKIDNMCIADWYGEDATKIPKHIFNEIKNIIKKLYVHNVHYIDITGYNFIEYDNKVWIIDFEHSKLVKNSFIEDFLKSDKQYWNSDFA